MNVADKLKHVAALGITFYPLVRPPYVGFGIKVHGKHFAMIHSTSGTAREAANLTLSTIKHLSIP